MTNTVSAAPGEVSIFDITEVKEELKSLTEMYSSLQEKVRIQSQTMSELARSLQDHFNVPWTKAHIRDGSLEAALRYIGMPEPEIKVLMAFAEEERTRSNRDTAKAEEVI